MVGVTREGTSSASFLNAGYVSGGKTGTAQVVGLRKGEKYDAKRVAERHKDHSLYIAFAPADHPKIAIAIIVENGGMGSAAAAPIVRKALDYYLLGKRPQDKDKTPALKADPALYRTDEDIKAAAEMSNELKPGGETEGNKD